MSSSTDPRLQRLLGGDHFALLRKRLRQRFERAPLDAVVESFRIDKLSREEHAALASLLGRPLRYAGSLQVDVRLVDAAFQNAGIATSLRDALERLDGPIANLATTRLTLQTLWSDVLGACANRELIGLLRAPAGIGLLKRLSRQSPTAVQFAVPLTNATVVSAASARRRRSSSVIASKRCCNDCRRAASRVRNWPPRCWATRTRSIAASRLRPSYWRSGVR